MTLVVPFGVRKRVGFSIGRQLIGEAGLKTPAEKRAWLKRAVGYLMEVRAIEGAIAAERILIPDGWLPKRGRLPRRTPAVP